MKKKILIILSIVIVLVIGGLILYKHETTLPEPKVSEGTRGELGIDANINEKNIDKYLNRKDSVYYDVRMLKDEADWEKIVGEGYIWKSLFTNNNGNYKSNYKESLEI